MNNKNYKVENLKTRYTGNMKTYQSANAIFNFMRELKFLQIMLEEKKITPRYNFEYIDYLDIAFKKIAFPMTCFCDISLHKIEPHTARYGTYGIAFNKKWGTDRDIQPIQYVNINSSLVEDFSKAYNDAEKIDISENIYIEQLQNYMLTHLLYMKPLSGYMDIFNKEEYKSFQDECEWRYIPNFSKFDTELDIIYTEKTTDKQLEMYNSALRTVDDCKLNFSYEDVKYLVVPTTGERLKLIEFITSLKNVKDENVKYELISKIMVLSELEEDV